MSTPRLYEDYPTEYTELFRRALIRPISIPFPSKLEAVRLRNHLYGFRTSIRDDPKAPNDLVITAPLISLMIENDTLIIHRPKRTTNMRKALEGAET